MIYKILLVWVFLIAFIIGTIGGYVFVGYAVEKDCRNTIKSYDNYINKHCSQNLYFQVEEGGLNWTIQT